MEHASFIFGSWGITAASVGVYVFWVIRRGRELAKHATREDMPWT